MAGTSVFIRQYNGMLPRGDDAFATAASLAFLRTMPRRYEAVGTRSPGYRVTAKIPPMPGQSQDTDRSSDAVSTGPPLKVVGILRGLIHRYRPWIPYVVLFVGLGLTAALAYYVNATTRVQASRDLGNATENTYGVIAIGLAVNLLLFAMTRSQNVAHQAIIESEARKRIILDSALDCIISVDHAGKVLEFNPTAERTFGYRNREVVGKSLTELVALPLQNEDHEQGLQNYLARDINLGRRIELSAVRANGRQFPAEMAITRVDLQGQPLFIAYLRDVTARKRLEARFRTTVESAPIAMLMIDAAGVIVLVNTETEKLFGYARRELLGQHMEILVPQRSRARHPQMRAQFFAAPEVRRMGAGRDLFGLRKDGSEFPVEIGLNPIEMEEGLFVLSAIVDITARKRLEARFRATVESAPTAMVMVNHEGHIVLVNAEAEKMFGYLREELLGRSIEGLIPERFRSGHPHMRTRFFAAPEARRMGAGRDLFGLRKDGSEFPVEIGLSPVETEEGLFVLSAIVDITERKRLEAALRQANEALDQRVQERTAELALQTEKLKQTNDALEKSNLELQQFAYIASHDLQSPLRSISGFVQLLQFEYEGKLSEQADEWIARTVQSIQQMQRLINDVLSYSRVDARSRPFERIRFRDVFDDTIVLLEASIRDAAAAVTCDELPEVVGDRAQLVQLLQNIIGNALIYHGDKPPRIHVSAQRQGNEWVFSVRDNGIGIDPKYYEQIFEIFRRLHNQQEYPGTGIGLAVCRRVIHRHGGRIWVESEPGHGSVFYFTMPEKEISNL